MSSYTYGDVARLGDQPGRPGVLSLLNSLEAESFSKMTVADKFRIARFVQLAGGALVRYEQLLLEAARRYGNEVEGSRVVVKPENVKEFEEERAKLMALECEELGSLKPLPLSAYEGLPLTPRELALLGNFIVPPEI